MALIPTQVTFRGLAHSNVLEADIRHRVAWLEQFYAGIGRCRVLVEVPHRHRHRGRHFHVRIDITVPGRDPIVVSHEPSLHAGLKDVEDAAAHKCAEIDSVHRHGSWQFARRSTWPAASWKTRHASSDMPSRHMTCVRRGPKLRSEKNRRAIRRPFNVNRLGRLLARAGRRVLRRFLRPADLIVMRAIGVKRRVDHFLEHILGFDDGAWR